MSLFSKQQKENYESFYKLPCQFLLIYPVFKEGSIEISFIMPFHLYCNRYYFSCQIIYVSFFRLFSPSMLWLVIRLSVAMFVLNCLVYCAVPNPSLRENLPIAKEQQSRNELKSTSETKLPNIASKQTATPTVKTTRKETTKKTPAPALVNEFSLEEILFKGRQSSKKTVVQFILFYLACVHLPTHCCKVCRWMYILTFCLSHVSIPFKYRTERVDNSGASVYKKA